MFAGPLANFILAIFIFTSIYMFSGKDFTPAQIQLVQKDSPAQIAGIKKNDVILSINNNKIQSILDVSTYINSSTDDLINLTILRNDKELTISVKPNKIKGKDSLGNKVNKKIIGINISPINNEFKNEKLGPATALFYAVNEVYYVSTSSLKYIGSMLTGNGDTSQLGGPIRIAKISGQVAEFGILPFISLMAYISISLGLINLFPIPMLDGGHLMFYGIEKVLGRPLSQKTQEGFFRIGMFLLLSLMFFTTFNDLKDVGLFKFFNNYIS